MTGQLATLTRWEWFKLRRRWMPWILLVILVGFSQLAVWGQYFSYRRTLSEPTSVVIGGIPGIPRVTLNCADPLGEVKRQVPPDTDPQLVELARRRLDTECRRRLAQREADLIDARAAFSLPGSIPRALQVTEQIGVILVAILVASSIGTEYTWGSLRLTLAKGTKRWHYLAMKLGVMALASLAALIIVLPFTAASSLAAAWLTGGIDGGFFGARFIGDLVAQVCRVWFALWPYIALTTAVTVLTRSSAVGIGVGIAYDLVERIATAILLEAFGWFQPVSQYLVGINNSGWVFAISNDRSSGFALSRAFADSAPGQWHAFIVLWIYIVALGGIAFWLFRTRDVTGSGG